MHPSWKRYYSHQRKVVSGDPTYANISYCYKDYSDLICSSGKSFKNQRRFEATLRNAQATATKSEWMGRGFGIWKASGEGLFSEESIIQCQKSALRRGVVPVLSRRQWEDLRFEN